MIPSSPFLSQAASYITLKGSAVEKARLHAILTGEPPTPEAAQSLLSGQQPDGGWSPFWATGYSSLDATCYRLAQAEQLGVNPSEPGIQHALRFLAARQQPDGSFEEDASVSTAPPWAQPGDLAARLYLTANCGFWLALLGAPADLPQRAGIHLQEHLDATGRFPSFLHTHWLAAGLWVLLDRQAAASLLLSYLEQRLPEFSPSALAWMLTTLRLSGLPAGHPVLRRAANLLIGLQQADGRWESEDGTEREVHATLEALRAILLTIKEN